MSQKEIDRALEACDEWARKVKRESGKEPTFSERLAFAVGYARGAKDARRGR